MRLGSFLDLSDRRSAWLRWLVAGLLFLALMVVAARVAGAHSFTHDSGVAPAACAESGSMPCSGDGGHAKGQGCQGALGCHVMDVQPELAVAAPAQRRSFPLLELPSLASEDIAPLFHPPKRPAPV